MTSLEGLAKVYNEEIHRLELRIVELQSQITDLKADRDYWKSRTLQLELWDGARNKRAPEKAQPLVVREAKAAHMLDVSLGTLRKWRSEKRGPTFVRMGRCVGYRISDLESFIKAGVLKKDA